VDVRTDRLSTVPLRLGFQPNSPPQIAHLPALPGLPDLRPDRELSPWFRLTSELTLVNPSLEKLHW
jgi:hypothetical protein